MRNTEKASRKSSSNCANSSGASNAVQPASRWFRHATGIEDNHARDLPQESRLVFGTIGDHARILELLVQSYQSDLSDDFQSRLDEPHYEPSDRLLLERNGKLIGHLQLSRLVGWFDSQRCPISKLQDLVLLPEFDSEDFTLSLLHTAEAIAVEQGAVLGIIHTDRCEHFKAHGWSYCHGQGYTQANTRALLAHLDSQLTKPRHGQHSIAVESWRHYDLEKIKSIYERIAPCMWGTLHRTDEYWRWLVGRKAHDQILMATQGRRNKIDGQTSTRAIGYAVLHDSHVIELLTLPDQQLARTLLMARACHDAIDHDRHFVELHTPAADSFHELLVTAGGNWFTPRKSGSPAWMLKLFNPERWLERLYPLFHQRARETGIKRPLLIPFLVNGKQIQLRLTRRSVRLEHSSEKIPDLPVQCDWHTFQNLLTSNLTFTDAMERGRLQTDNLEMIEILTAIFPPKLFWQSPFEMLKL